MTEQLKKASKSIYTLEIYNPQNNPTTKLLMNIRSAMENLYSSEIDYGNDVFVSPSRKGVTNWDKGDLINIKTSTYIWLPEESTIEEPELRVNTQYYSIETKKNIDLSKAEVEFDTKQKQTCAIVPLDNLLLRFKAAREYEVQLKDREFVPFSTFRCYYFAKSKSNGAITKIARARFIIEAEYIGTEQEDGSFIYLG